MADPLDEPLKPKKMWFAPPWVGYFPKLLRNRPYHPEREDWYADLSYKNQRPECRRFPFPQLQEHDMFYYDPPVEPGKAFGGVNGMDGWYRPNTAMKADQPGNFYEFRDNLMKNSLQYKQIAEKWKISDEHPGIEVNPLLDSINHLETNALGKGPVFPNLFFHLGPRFFDKPLNEGCLEKGLCLVKYAGLCSLAFSLLDIRSNPPPNMPYSWGISAIFKRWAKILPMPCLLSFIYGVGVCTSAVALKVDDLRNQNFASLATGVTYALIKDSWMKGTAVYLTLLVLSGFVQHARLNVKGFQGTVHPQMTAGMFSGPLTWKYMSLGDAELPTKTY